MNMPAFDTATAAGSGAMVHFFSRFVTLKKKTEESGRIIGEYRDFIRIRQAGQDKSEVVREVKPQHKQEYAREWDAYQRGLEQVPDGTPIGEWPAVTSSRCEELKLKGVHTIEQMAGMADADTQHIMGGMELKKKATAYIEELAHVSQSAVVKSDSNTLVESSNLLSNQAQALEINVEYAANEALSLIHTIVEHQAAVNESNERAIKHFESEMKRAQLAMAHAQETHSDMTGKLSNAKELADAKLRAWNQKVVLSEKKVEHDLGPQIGPAKIATDTPVPTKPPAEIKTSDEGDGGDPVDDEFFETKTEGAT